MSTLTLNSNGKNIEVISIEDLGDRKRIFLGDVDSDIILRSLNGIKIQVGNKIIDTGFSYNQTDNTLTTSSSVKQYSNIEDNFSSIEGSLIDGDLIYDIIVKKLYIYSGSTLITLTNTSESKQYLSFLETQNLTGSEKILLLKNAGISVIDLKTLTNIYPSDSYTNMIVYVAEEKQHYCLIGDNSRSMSSWTPIYISSIKGGVSNGAIVIDPLNVNEVRSALHVNGYYNSNVISNISETQSIFSIGDIRLNRGLAAWCNSDGNVYIQGLDKTIDTGIVFVTTTGDITNNLISLKGQKVGINTNVNDKYLTAIGGDTVFENKVFLKDNLSSELFSSGFAGYGMKLGRDNNGYWSLDIDNLTVRQRMSIYELVVNQIKATNGSLWVSDGAKIKTATKHADMPVYIKARYAGNYKAGLNNTFIEIAIEDRPPYALVYNPTNNVSNLTPFKMGFGYGDSYLNIVNNVATYVNPTYDTFINQNGSYVAIPPTHRLDPVLGFVPDTNGEYILADTVSIYGITFEDIPPFFEGDLVRMQNWDTKLNKLRFARCQVGIQRNTSGPASTPEVLVYTFQGDDLVNGLSLVRIGNNKDNIMSEFTVSGGTIIREKTNGSLIPGAVWVRDVSIEQAEPNRLGAIYLTAADSGAPYIDIIDKVESHNAFNPARSEPNPDSSIVEVMQTRLKVRLGKLAGLIDLDMGLDGGTWQKYLYGLYTDSGFFKGNLVAQAGKIGDMFLKEGSLFTYNDGNIHTPMDFEYENSNNQITIGGKINTNWLFGKDLAGVLLDGKSSRFSLGSKLKYENGNLTIDGQISATTGLIGGWEITDKGIKKNTTLSGIGMLSSYLTEGPTIYSGCTYDNFLLDKENAKFYVDANGNLKSKSGNIGGFLITEFNIKSIDNNIVLNSSGSVYFGSGRIGTWEINQYSISKSLLTLLPPPCPGCQPTQVWKSIGIYGNDDKAAFFAGSENGADSGDYTDSPFYVNEKGFAKITSGNIGGFLVSANSIKAESGTGLDSTSLELNSNDAVLRINGVNNQFEAILGKTQIWGSALYLSSGYAVNQASVGLVVNYSRNDNKQTYGAIGIYSFDKIVTEYGFYDLSSYPIEMSSIFDYSISVLQSNKLCVTATVSNTLKLPSIENVLLSTKGNITNTFVTCFRLAIQCSSLSTTSFNLISNGEWVIKSNSAATLTSITMNPGNHIVLDLYYNSYITDKFIAQVVTFSA